MGPLRGNEAQDEGQVDEAAVLGGRSDGDVVGGRRAVERTSLNAVGGQPILAARWRRMIAAHRRTNR